MQRNTHAHPVLHATILMALVTSASAVAQTPTASAPASQPSAENGTVVEKWVESDNDVSPLRAVARLVDGKIEGECRFFTRSGKLYKVETYRNGVLDGPLTRLYPNGKKYFVADFRKGNLVQTMTWYPNGEVAGLVEYADGRPHGKQITCFPNGRKSVEATRVKGLAQGRRNHYLPDGTLFGVTFWENNRQVGQRVTSQPNQQELREIEKVAGFAECVQANFWADEE
jgi:hypothetical protein